MKLSKQERIGALIILAIVILALGAFLLVKPKFEEVAATRATLETREKELADAKQRQQQKAPLRMQIEQQYEEGQHMADMFFPELTAYDAHNAFTDFIKQLDFPVVVEEISVSEPDTETLNVSFFTPTEVSYALKTYVTQSRDMTEEERQARERIEALQSALNSQQTIGASKVEFTVTTLTLDDMLKFIDAVNDYKIMEEGASEEVRKAVSIGSMGIDYELTDQLYDLLSQASSEEIAREGRALLRELGFEGYEESADTPPEEIVLEIPITYEFSEAMTFLSIARMQDPKPLLDSQDGIAE